MRPGRYTHDAQTHNRRAAVQIVPWLVERHAPRTVLDVGCGTGTWATVFADHGCDVRGLDGEEVSDELLQIPRERFEVVDFESDTAPGGKYDLALCLEVAEHLTEPAGQRLLDYLVSVTDVVVFSAAVPGQGGDHHLNEQWPTYWQAHFEARGYGCHDRVRDRFWDDENVEWWYRQNMFVAQRLRSDTKPLRHMVHPGLLAKKVRLIDDFYDGRVPLRTGALVFGRSLVRALKRS